MTAKVTTKSTKEVDEAQYVATEKKKKSSGCCSCLKIIYYILQALFFVLGAAIIGLAGYMMSVLKTNNGFLYIFGGVGLAIAFLSIFGMVCVMMRAKFLTILYILLIAGICAVETVAWTKTGEISNESVVSSFQDAWGKLDDTAKTGIQNALQCCSLSDTDLTGTKTPPCPESATKTCSGAVNDLVDSFKSGSQVSYIVALSIEGVTLALTVVLVYCYC